MDNSHRGDGITAEFLRSHIDGKFKMGDHDLLPHKENGDNYAGDFRAPEMPGLQSMHILFVREHNRIADLVKEALQNSGHGECIKEFGLETGLFFKHLHNSHTIFIYGNSRYKQ